jgi:hypothetical protein
LAIVVSLQLAPKSLYTLVCSIGSNFEILEKCILFVFFCCKQMQKSSELGMLRYGRCFALIDNDFRFSVVQPLANFYRPMALLQAQFLLHDPILAFETKP